MSQTGKQNPLGVNVNSSLLQNIGLRINPRVPRYVGESKTNDDYTFGLLVSNTCLKWITYAINTAYARNFMSTSLYNNLISIGNTSIPLLGNSKPAQYAQIDTSGQWTSGGTPATTGYYLTGNTGQGQEASWLPYDSSNPNSSITKWGFLRLYALQAWNEFNWNGVPTNSVQYTDFLSSFLTANSFVNYNNSAINAMVQSKSFLDGVYSNMNDLISADVTGVSLSLPSFGSDCIKAGKIINLAHIDVFGMPSVLLRTLKKYNTITQSVSVALLSSGLTISELDVILNGGPVTKKQEQQIYGAFLIIVGQDLEDVLFALNCKTDGLESLADLLNVRKIFPSSYQSLTVGVYNTLDSPSNSKTYYPIYIGNSVNSKLSNPAIEKQIGTYIPKGTPPIVDSPTAGSNFSIQPLKEGFGSYLDGILPDDLAIAAGAFSMSMQQIKYIKNIEFEKFAQVIPGLETTKGLGLVNGSNVPVDVNLVNQATPLIALGSGVSGTYTMSDFFGCMSGLPYMWDQLYSNIRAIQTTKLINIYDQLYLAVDWKQAEATVQFTLSAVANGGSYDYFYQITGVTLTNNGGGYSRGGAPAPTATISGTSGATLGGITVQTVNSPVNTYGKVLTLVLTNPGSSTLYGSGASATPPNPNLTVSFQAPPSSTLPILANGSKSTSGTNSTTGTAGWSNPSLMPATVQAYIDQANTEIQSIQNANARISNMTNIIYNSAGVQLTIEQRARYIGLAPVPTVVRDNRLNPYPLITFSFVDAVPTLAEEVLPHMSVQTLEAISDLTTPGGQSLVGMMRQERNSKRLSYVGVDLDNNIAGDLPRKVQQMLVTNGTAPNAVTGITVPGVGTYTTPSILANDTLTPVLTTDSQNNAQYTNTLTPIPKSYFNQNNAQYINTSAATKSGEYSPIDRILQATNPDTSIVTAGDRLPTGNEEPAEYGSALPGSLSGSPYRLEPTPNTVISSVFDVPEAIEDVSKCNCDCWVD